MFHQYMLFHHFPVESKHFNMIRSDPKTDFSWAVISALGEGVNIHILVFSQSISLLETKLISKKIRPVEYVNQKEISIGNWVSMPI